MQAVLYYCRFDCSYLNAGGIRGVWLQLLESRRYCRFDCSYLNAGCIVGLTAATWMKAVLYYCRFDCGYLNAGGIVGLTVDYLIAGCIVGLTAATWEQAILYYCRFDCGLPDSRKKESTASTPLVMYWKEALPNKLWNPYTASPVG